MGLTTDRHDGCLHEIDPVTNMQHCYLIAPDGERKNLVRPVCLSYVHRTCGTVTTMARELAETYAANPHFYGATYCAGCRAHFRVGHEGQFVWTSDGTLVGTKGVTVAERDRFRIEHDMGPLPPEMAG
jgi:hypothetical protein